MNGEIKVLINDQEAVVTSWSFRREMEHLYDFGSSTVIPMPGRAMLTIEAEIVSPVTIQGGDQFSDTQAIAGLRDLIDDLS